MKYLLALVALLVGGLFVLSAPTASAVDLFDCGNMSEDQCAIAKESKLQPNSSNAVWGVMQVVLTILGGVAVIMIIVGGIRYTTSLGDPAAVTSAKNTILYAVIGLVVAILAGTIVTLVAQNVKIQ